MLAEHPVPTPLAPLAWCRVPEDCPEEVRDIIRRCLDPDPNVRPTAAELVQLLTLAPAPAPPGGTTPVRRYSHAVSARPPMTSGTVSAAASADTSDAAVRMGSAEKISPASTVLEPIPSAVIGPARSQSCALPTRSQSGALARSSGPGSPLPPLHPGRRSMDWAPHSEAAAGPAGTAQRSAQLPSTAGSAGGPSDAAQPLQQRPPPFNVPSPWASAAAAASREPATLPAAGGEPASVPDAGSEAAAGSPGDS